MSQETISPRWTPTTKLLIGLVIVGIVTFLVNRFSNLITPLLFIFIFAYLLHPITSALSRGLRISWKASVNLVYLLILLFGIGILTASGVGLVQQVQNLIEAVQTNVKNLPQIIEDLSGQVFQIGPITLDMSTVNLQEVSQQLLSYVQPVLGQTGNIVGTLASGAAETLGWTFFITIVSYFLMAESSGMRGDLFKVELPGYEEDFQHLGSELSRIWNAFLRGQIFIFVLATVIYIFVLTILGVDYAIGLALMAGLAKFLPYIGPAITWIVMALVTFFQTPKPFFDDPGWVYVLVVVGITLFIDQIIDSFIVPRIMARTLKVHPAAVLVTAIISASLLGILGVVIAAPLLASVTLLSRYIGRKLFDQDPWPPQKDAHYDDSFEMEWLNKIKSFFIRKTKSVAKTQKENTNEQPKP